ncbi:hypothetical protein K2173_018314 [Erythroxylum novogranatense]|uniref:G3BP-like protein n=1 Tax=Erythroxylum novogranatense TaxID=1862640 RepID=A0AAV8UA26_9ROSI|nr:hypothetical protein K2173_018314 [Erythroxylum novogranatense]
MMAASASQTAIPTADIVGNAFVHQYYLILHQSPELVHRFYQDVSKLGRPEDNGVMSITTTMHAINERILSLGCGQFTAEICSVDSQESYQGGVLVLVTGYLIGNNNVRQKFTQSFFLAPQDTGYFVLNDVFRYVDEPKQQSANHDSGKVEASHSPEQEPSSVQDSHVSEQATALSEQVNVEEVYDPSDNEDGSVVEEEPLIPEVMDEVSDESQMVVKSSTKIEELPKKSYASIVKVMKENAATFTSSSPPSLRSAQKSQEQINASLPQTIIIETQGFNTNLTENGNALENEAEGPSIYVKGLPLDATPALLENEFKKFGPIRTGGIQVRSQKGFCFGFVEFDVASAVQSALEASPIMINGCRVVVEEKRSTSRGNNRGRFSSGGGAVYRNEGVRGRGNFGGGKAYNRGDFSSKSEFGNRNGGRGGFSNRGGDGYRRDKMGNTSGRANRAGGFNLNATAKTMTPRVSATA